MDRLNSLIWDFYSLRLPQIANPSASRPLSSLRRSLPLSIALCLSVRPSTALHTSILFVFHKSQTLAAARPLPSLRRSLPLSIALCLSVHPSTALHQIFIGIFISFSTPLFFARQTLVRKLPFSMAHWHPNIGFPLAVPVAMAEEHLVFRPHLL